MRLCTIGILITTTLASRCAREVVTSPLSGPPFCSRAALSAWTWTAPPVCLIGLMLQLVGKGGGNHLGLCLTSLMIA